MPAFPLRYSGGLLKPQRSPWTYSRRGNAAAKARQAALILGALRAVSGCSTGPAPVPTADPPSGASRPDAGAPDAPSAPDATPAPRAPSCAGLLGDLSVAGQALTPAFSACVHDYYVRCSSGTNGLDVSMTPSQGARVALTEPMKLSATDARRSVHVDLAENQALVATASNARSSEEYWVRCLPEDFPWIRMEAHPSAGTPPPGYYLVGNQIVGLGPGYAMILDGRGVPVWYVRQAAGSVVVDVDVVVPGAISFFPATSQPQQIEFHYVDPVSTTYVAPPHFNPHELRLLRNGHFQVLGGINTTGVDLTGLSVSLPDAGVIDLGPGSTIEDQLIYGVDGAGRAAWSWLASEHLDAAKESTGPLAALRNHTILVDTFHANSIDVDPSTGNLLVSMRNLDALLYIDKTTGKVLWKMGGTEHSHDHPIYVPVKDAFDCQHDARFQPGWSTPCWGWQGQISMFDDQSTTAAPARGVVYDVTVVRPDLPPGCMAPAGAVTGATVAWEYRGGRNSGSTGSFRISPDGSRVIGWGSGGVPGLAFSEVDADGNDLLDFYFASGNSTFRAIKVPLTAFNLEVLRRTAGLPY